MNTSQLISKGHVDISKVSVGFWGSGSWDKSCYFTWAWWLLCARCGFLFIPDKSTWSPGFTSPLVDFVTLVCKQYGIGLHLWRHVNNVGWVLLLINNGCESEMSCKHSHYERALTVFPAHISFHCGLTRKWYLLAAAPINVFIHKYRTV